MATGTERQPSAAAAAALDCWGCTSSNEFTCMCIDAPESTTNSLSSGLITDGVGRHQILRRREERGLVLLQVSAEMCTLLLSSHMLLCEPIVLVLTYPLEWSKEAVDYRSHRLACTVDADWITRIFGNIDLIFCGSTS